MTESHAKSKNNIRIKFSADSNVEKHLVSLFKLNTRKRRMEVSNLSFIANPPECPMQLFATWHDDAQQHIGSYLDTMTIAGLSE